MKTITIGDKVLHYEDRLTLGSMVSLEEQGFDMTDTKGKHMRLTMAIMRLVVKQVEVDNGLIRDKDEIYELLKGLSHAETGQASAIIQDVVAEKKKPTRQVARKSTRAKAKK